MSEHNVGKLIAKLRKENGWTQVELAQRLQVSDKAISKWESGAGLPEISQFPALARLFNVSIDYILTGKEIEKEIITISKSELCAKNDDVELAEEVKDLPSDENGKTIVDYIVKYQSLNVFKRLCEIDDRFITRFDIVVALTFSMLSNSLYLLNGKRFGNIEFENENSIKRLLPISTDEEYEPDGGKQCCLLPKSFFEMIVTDDRINADTMDILLSPQDSRKCVWYRAFPLLIDYAYRNGKIELFNRLLDLAEKNNEYAYSNIKLNSVMSSVKRCYIIWKDYGLVQVYQSTFQCALNNGDFDIIERFNKINSKLKKYCLSIACYVASDDVIRVAKLKLDKSVSKTDLKIQSAIHNGIINIKELKEITDFAAVKKALNDYPVHPFELVYRMYQQQKWRELFEFSVDYDINRLSDAILHQNKEDIEENILEVWTEYNQPYRLKELCISNDELYVSISNHNQKSIQEVIDYLNEVRQRIISELSNKFDKEKIVGELTKDYFYSELSKGNKELVIIKLCVRMEAILKCDYNYQGDFSEMLDHFCKQFNTYDDEDNNYDPHTPAMLNRLRRQRNSIVHSEKTVEPMSDDDVKQCIDYICSL